MDGDNGFLNWRRKLYEENPNLGYIAFGWCRDGKPYIETRGVSKEVLEEIFSKIALVKGLLAFKEEIYKEYMKYGLTQFFFRNLTKLQMKAWKVLRNHYKKELMDGPFAFVDEIDNWIIANHFQRGLKIQDF